MKKQSGFTLIEIFITVAIIAILSAIAIPQYQDYVTRGELRLGAQVAGPGTAVYVDAMTLYGFTAGPEGCTFLNFRGVPSVGYLTREEFLAGRAATPASAASASAAPATRA